MSRMKQPPVAPPWSARGADDLDGLLRSFFQAELPSPWPAPALPAEPPTTPAPRRPLWRSRAALAASVALLLAGNLFLAPRFQGTEPPSADPGSGPIIVRSFLPSFSTTE